jgi:chorismate mutase
MGRQKLQSANLPPLERMQVAAFHAIYKRARKRPIESRNAREEDFVEALMATCDDRMAAVDPELVAQWLANYAQ